MVNNASTTRIRPRTVTVAAVLQFLVAALFLVAPVVGLVFGADVQAAAEAEVERQGLPATVLADNGIMLGEDAAATFFPIAVALSVAVLGWLNLAGKRAGRVLSLIFQPLVIVLDVAIYVSQLYVVEAVESVFEQSGDAALQSIDAQALIDAAYSAYPAWVSSLADVRIFLTPLASLIVIVLLLVPSARAYFRKKPLAS